MSIISNSITRCRSFVLDQALVMDDSQNSSIINTIANKCLIPLASLLEKGKMRRISIDQNNHIEELPMRTQLIYPSVAKVLVIFTTGIAVLLKILNYYFSSQARKHLDVIRYHKYEENSYCPEILQIFGGVAAIKQLPYFNQSIGDDPGESAESLQLIMNAIIESKEQDLFQGVLEGNQMNFPLLAFKYTHFQKRPDSNIPQSEYFTQLYYKDTNGKWIAVHHESNTNNNSVVNTCACKMIFSNIVTKGYSFEFDFNNQFIPDAKLTNDAFNYYRGHITWNEAISIKD